jgi:hypothetical protein
VKKKRAKHRVASPLRRESERALLEQIRRLLALPPHRRPIPPQAAARRRDRALTPDEASRYRRASALWPSRADPIAIMRPAVSRA